MAEVYLSPDEAAARLSVTPKTIRKWLNEGRLRGTKLGRLWRIKESDLLALTETGFEEEKD
ncbi:MAG: helix-turn-helix domain-containing protein [Bacillota bacterium]|nr:helix-turn-helix domain-containing protein [Bacillota bacterium]